MTNTGNISYSYDDENRLALASDDVNHTYRFGYVHDGLGRLRVRQQYQWMNVGLRGYMWVPTTGYDYIYDGMRVIQERMASGSTLLYSYTRGSDLSGTLEGAGGIGGLLARSSIYSSGNWTSNAYYHADGNGNITYLINSSRSMLASYIYDPFGNTIAKTGSLCDDNTYRFSSKQIDVNTGLYYYGYRFYDPNSQRWINRDPIEERGGLNLYEFAWNDPVDLFDRFGLFVKPTSYPPADPNDNTIVCYNGKLTIQNKNKGVGRKCYGVHEYSHLQDWLKQYGDDVCKGQKNGTTPVGGDGYHEFLRQSECKAYKADKKCFEDLLKNCKAKDKDAI